MSRKLFSLAVAVLVVLAAFAVARSASATAFLYMNASINDPVEAPTAPDATFNGPGVVSGGTWNDNVISNMVFTTPTNGSDYTTGGLGYITGPLVDASGNPTSVTFTDASRQAGDPGGNLYPPNIPLFSGYVYQTVSLPAELNNVPAGNYDLYLYSQVATGGSGYSTTFTVGATSQTVTNDGNASSFDSSNYTEFLNVSPVLGTLAFYLSGPATIGGNTNFLSLDGFQLVNLNTPEPSSVVLQGIALSLAAFVVRRHRKR